MAAIFPTALAPPCYLAIAKSNSPHFSATGFALVTKPSNAGHSEFLHIVGVDVPFRIVKQGSLEQNDLAFLSVDEALLPGHPSNEAKSLCKPPLPVRANVICRLSTPSWLVAEYSFESGLASMVKWYLDNRAWWHPLVAAGDATHRRGLPKKDT